MGYNSSGIRPIELAGKTNHTDFVDEESKSFLSKCFIPQQNFDIEPFKNLFYDFDKKPNNIKYVIAIDGGYTEIIVRKFPSSKFIAIKAGALLLDKEKINDLEKESFISPEDINKIKNIGKSKLILPIQNVMNNNYDTFLNFVRATIFDFFKKHDFNLISALQWLIYREFLPNPIDEWNLATHPTRQDCNNINLKRDAFKNYMIDSDDPIYITDVLRLHELIDEEIGAERIVNYLLSAIEQMIMVSIIKEIYNKNPGKLSEFLFILDRPLAFFGQTANLHKPMREMLNYFREQNINLNIVGLEKSGPFVEHAKELVSSGILKNGQYVLLSNDYIYKNILAKTSKSGIYGETTYYGCKLIFNSHQDNVNVCTIPIIPYEKIKDPLPEYFLNLNEILSTIEDLKCSLYENAILPIALVNSAVSISKYPGEVSLERLVKDIIQYGSNI